MTKVRIEVSLAELDVVRLALGRMVEPITPAKRVARPAVRSMGKPPTLTAKAKAYLEHEWATVVQRSIDEPGHWGNLLASHVGAGKAADFLGRRSVDEVKRAWGVEV